MNSSPAKPASTQVVITIRPPGRHTRTSSLGRPLMVGREHRPERGGHAIEAVVLKRQLLGVALHPLDFHARFAGPPNRVIQKLWSDV